jgi:uncharacterized membrane protein
MVMKSMEIKKTPRHSLLKPETFLLVFGILVGILFCLLIPYGAGFDEESHTVRVFDLARFHVFPNRGLENDGYTFSEFYTLSYQRRTYQSPADDMFSSENFWKKADWNNMAQGDTRTTYFPADYLLQTIIAGISWRALNLPVLPVIIFMRMAGFAFYLFMCFLTMRALPFGKWLFLVAAFIPMGLFQAATINADGFTIACSYFFVGVVINVFAKPDKTITNKDAWKIAIASILIGCGKPLTVFLLLLLLILLRHKVETKSGKYILAGGIVLSAIISFGWMCLMIFTINTSREITSFYDQGGLVLSNPLDFIWIYFKGLFLSIKGYYTNWIGVYGYWVGKVPVLVYILFPLSLLAALFTDTQKPAMPKKTRMIVLLVALLCLLIVATFNYIADYHPGIQSVGTKGGRYFLPFSLLVLIPFCGLLILSQKKQTLFQFLTMLLVISTVSIYGYGIYRTFYTSCVYAVTPSQPCWLPVYKNFELNNPYTAHVTQSTTISQSFTTECSSITAVQVRVESVSGNEQDKVQFSIEDKAGNEITSQEFLLSELSKGKMLSMPVNVQSENSLSMYRLTLSLPAGDSANADLGIIGRSGGSIYPDGTLQFNGKNQDADLYFQYSCDRAPVKTHVND